MSLDPSTAALQAKNVQLTQEKEQLKLMLSLLQENQDMKAKIQSFSGGPPDDFTGKLEGVSQGSQPRVIGEMVFQLDRRILSHIFQAQTRLYGFTLRNIPEKIEELSTHPLTGKVDMGYRHHLSQRHTHLMSKLSQLGYKAALHPLFSEFIVNTYGILKERPGENSPHGTEYNDPDLLRRLIVTTTPQKMHKDLHVLLTCLCYMAEQDRKLLMLW
uniref:Speriolin C-terminal domain-containing protein n=1 Tax=Nothobranchius furzeri TaxID=105023 RepID=A0A8C6NY75_NOTFU